MFKKFYFQSRHFKNLDSPNSFIERYVIKTVFPSTRNLNGATRWLEAAKVRPAGDGLEKATAGREEREKAKSCSTRESSEENISSVSTTAPSSSRLDAVTDRTSVE